MSEGGIGWYLVVMAWMGGEMVRRRERDGRRMINPKNTFIYQT